VPIWKTRQGLVAAAVAALALVVVIVIVASGGGHKKSAAPSSATPSHDEELQMDEESTSGELARLRARVKGAKTPDDVVHSLVRLAAAHPTDPEIPLTIGQVYCEKLWVDDCLEYFKKAIRIDGDMKSDERLLRSVMYGLGNDSRHTSVRRFLVKEIGEPAVPFLQDVVNGNWRKEVKDRAAATLEEIGA
jgi:hypothetical protein